MNTENSKINKSYKFFNKFTDKLNLKSPNNKNIEKYLLHIRKTLNFHTTTFIQIDFEQSKTFRITLSLSLKNKKP